MKQNSDKKYVVYRIYHNETEKSYIGITCDYKRRTKDHFGCYGESCLHRAIRKHSKDKFAHEIVFECKSWKEACQEEQEYIKEFNTKDPNGYNLTDGGEGASGYKPSLEARKNMSDAGKRKIFTKKHKQNLSKANRNSSLEIRTKISKTLMGHIIPNEVRQKISDTKKKLSKDQIIKIKIMLSERISHKSIAEKFDISRQTISGIKREEVYADIKLSK